MYLTKLLTYVGKVYRESMCPLHERILRTHFKSEPIVQAGAGSYMACLPQEQGETKPKKTALQYHRGIALSLHSVFNDLLWKPKYVPLIIREGGKSK